MIIMIIIIIEGKKIGVWFIPGQKRKICPLERTDHAPLWTPPPTPHPTNLHPSLQWQQKHTHKKKKEEISLNCSPAADRRGARPSLCLKYH